MDSFKVTLDATLLAVMTDYTSKILDDAIRRLADKYGFDIEDAKLFLQSGGVVIKYPPLEREKLPWTGVVRDCCKAIKKNGGLFTQCTGVIHSDDWCKPCSKEVAKKGKPTCGDVNDRLAKDPLDYQVGPVRIKPYIEYMKKHGIHREQVDQACAEYGITIDPKQFEVKKRARKPRDMSASIAVDAPAFEAFAADAEDAEQDATTAGGLDDDEQLESEEEDEYEAPEPAPATVIEHAPSPVTEPIAAAPSPVTEPIAAAPSPVTEPIAAAPSPVTEPIAAAPSPVAESTEPTAAATSPVAEPIEAPLAKITTELISAMDKKTVQAHCRSRGIDIDGKGVVQLKRELSASLK